VGIHAVSEKPYELAYEAAVRAIDAQAMLVESLRSRAGTMLAATALVTSFFGGQALARAGGSPLHLVSYTTGALASFIAVSALTLTMLLPFTLRVSVSAAEILRVVEGEPRDEQLTSAEVLREVALQLEAIYDSNTRQVRILEACFGLAIVSLVVEVAFWLAALTEGAL
jgi:hypothetical protein